MEIPSLIPRGNSKLAPSLNFAIACLKSFVMGVSLNEPEQLPLPCPTWVFSNSSDVHVAKDLFWFGEDYTPFKTFYTTIAGNTIEAIGVGSVSIPVQTNTQGGNATLHLKSVLHAPTSNTNVLGNMNEYRYTMSASSVEFNRIDDGSPVAFCKSEHEHNLYTLELSKPPVGPEVGPSALKPNVLYMIHAFWPRSERERFSNEQASSRRTDAENAWIKKHYGTEFKFLMTHGLNIHNEEHREEGRAIMRAFMSSNEDPMT